ncbi:hypothetical protein DMUE_4965 [Dictyocoela muelleri]|nr:hypothetical protein DMUE_4965 [Dictyocoela muelleri]
MLKRINRAKDHEFFSYISQNKNIVTMLQFLEIIPEEKHCGLCKKAMKIKENTRYNIGCAWKCPKCKRRVNIIDDCSLRGTKISPFVFLKFAFYFFNKNNFTAKYVMENCGIGEEMYARILSLIRSKISEYVLINRRQMGGISKEVQIDETFWARRKYGVGDIGKAVWIFGGVEFKTGYCYCEVVEKRDISTLHPIIKSQIKPKSYVVSDKWRAYNDLENMLQDSVSHKHYFVDPESKANTQSIENLWLHLKKIKHFSYGISLKTLPDHLNIFMFFRNHKDVEFVDFLILLMK